MTSDRLRLLGPEVILDGFRVPYLAIGPLQEAGKWPFHVDDRFGHDIADKELETVVDLFANAMAVAAGYTCFGKESELYNIWQAKGESRIPRFIASPESHFIEFCGTRVPYITLSPYLEIDGDTMIESLDIVVDHRLHFSLPKKTLEEIVWILADAMAVAAGFACFGKESCIPNKFQHRMICIDTTVSAIEEE